MCGRGPVSSQFVSTCVPCVCCGLSGSGGTVTCAGRVRVRFCARARLASREVVPLRVHNATRASGGFVWRCTVTLRGFTSVLPP